MTAATITNATRKSGSPRRGGSTFGNGGDGPKRRRGGVIAGVSALATAVRISCVD